MFQEDTVPASPSTHCPKHYPQVQIRILTWWMEPLPSRKLQVLDPRVWCPALDILGLETPPAPFVSMSPIHVIFSVSILPHPA